MKKLRQVALFKKEIGKFPLEVREDIFLLVMEYLKGSKLNSKQFKTFKLSASIKIQEFKVKDRFGNWRAVSFLDKEKTLTFVYAFHKKSQALLEKDKRIIISRIQKEKI